MTTSRFHGACVLFGLDRPPRGVAWDHPRVPSVVLGPQPLRLNSHPVPPAYMAAGIEREQRRAAIQEWLETACGDYAAGHVRFVASYLAFVHDDLETCRADLQARLFGGLFSAEDWAWSALRPLPRAWIDIDGVPVSADFVFWDGRQLTVVQLAPRPSDIALRNAGAAILQAPAAFPDSFRNQWRGEKLPSSPFRRAIPAP